MARSFKRSPVSGWTTSPSEKDDKRQWHRAYRRAVHQALHTGAPIPHHYEYSDPWCMGKDGKSHWYDRVSDHSAIPERLRYHYPEHVTTWAELSRWMMRK